METYHFVTEWFFRVPVDRVFEETADIEAYPAWWKSLRKAKMRGSEAKLQLGSIAIARSKAPCLSASASRWK